MLSTPAPIPTSIIPALIAFATSTQACNPLEHCLFRLLTAVLAGNPAANAAALNSVAPPPGARTVPTAMSSTSLGSNFDFEMTDLKTPWSRSAAAVSLKPPLPPRVMAVLRAHVTTTSSGERVRMLLEPVVDRSDSEARRWEETWERRSWA